MKRTIQTIVCVIVGLMFINSGLNKIFNYLPMPSDLPEAVAKDNAAMAEIAWLLPLIAVAEILGGILLIVPKTRALGAIVLFPVMIGIMLSHITTMPETLALPAVFFAVILWVIYDNREKYMPMIR